MEPPEQDVSREKGAQKKNQSPKKTKGGRTKQTPKKSVGGKSPRLNVQSKEKRQQVGKAPRKHRFRPGTGTIFLLLIF